MPTAPPPPPRKSAQAPTPVERKPKKFTVSNVSCTNGQAIVIYGTGGVGKTSLASLAPSPIFLNLDRDESKTNIRQVNGVETFVDMRDALRDEGIWKDCKTVVVDTATQAQQLAENYTLETVPHEKGHRVSSIEGYGYGKGYQFVLETFRLLLADLDRHKRAGRNVVLVCHSTTSMAPNPEGDDYLRYEPDLYQPPKTGRIRDAVKNWCDHMLFINYDKAVKDGKAVGAGTRTIYTQELPIFWAKSRSVNKTIQYEQGSDEIWKLILGGKQ